MDGHLLHYEQSIRAVGDLLLHCNPPVCVVDDHVLPESRKEKVTEPPTQQGLCVKASQEPGLSTQFFRRDRYAMRMEAALRL